MERYKKGPEIYYLREVETEGVFEVTKDKPAGGEVYKTREVFDEKGNLTIFFIKKDPAGAGS